MHAEILNDEYSTILTRLLMALFAGGVIGLERAFQGRLAGFRTHALVCTASSLLIIFTKFQLDLLDSLPLETIRIDPSRMAQGIMTGIGFLGAGVIMKEKFSIRGLTTAASIWITASIGITVGHGFYFASTAATLITLVALSLFGWLERKLPTRRFGKVMIKFKRDERIAKKKIYEIIEEHASKASNLSYHLIDDGRFLQYEFTIQTTDPNNFHKLTETLCNIKQITEFRLIPTGE